MDVTIARSDTGPSTRPLPTLDPLRVRVAFQQYAPAASSQRYADLRVDMASDRFGQREYASVADAVRAARELSNQHGRAGIAVVRETAVSYVPTSTFVLRPLDVVATGGLRFGDASASVGHWRGTVDARPRTQDTVSNVLGAAPMAIAARDALTSFQLLDVAAVVAGDTVAERATGQVGWQPGGATRALPWSTAGG
ncbi:MAG: hypothetical protein JWM98_403 [Thermoleophilia bacterium]|nr:hypothetical protein [Thermoleophilia bacterium]